MTQGATGAGYQLRIFLSSTHYGLEDLRGELDDYIRQFGLPYISSELGFPDHAGLPPYVGCLRVLEKCQIVIGIIDRRYGQCFPDWEPYPEYANLSPTHAELRHALKTGKRFWIYVRDSVASYYDLYRKNKEVFGLLSLPEGLQTETLEMYRELKTVSPAPWIEIFHDVRQVKVSIRKRLLNDLYQAFEESESLKLSAAPAESRVPKRVFLDPKELQEGWSTIAEAASILGITTDEVTRLLSTGQLLPRYYRETVLVSTASLRKQQKSGPVLPNGATAKRQTVKKSHTTATVGDAKQDTDGVSARTARPRGGRSTSRRKSKCVD